MELERNLENIAQMAKVKEKENSSFQSYLKNQDTDKIDAIAHRLNDEITALIDCTECGNCCQNLRPIATNEELRVFVEPQNIEKFKYLEGFQCKNLKDKKCTIYTTRPEVCRLYPFLDRDKFITRTYGVLQNYEHCPIVFNVFELLKIELGWCVENTSVK
ncbi:MAG: YkgJ family cysteine cluster protein [Salinivirgaceae bacterium]|nr:YkgJ family cysteine cluster protein [Salinivirgaceae bacterium]